MTPTKNAYERITDEILRRLERGVVPWRRPWSGAQGAPQNLRGTGYRGINRILLASMGYGSRYWMTFKQAKQHGGHVRRGERGCPVVFWKWHERENAETGERERVPVLRLYTVFNAEQVEGVDVPAPETAERPFSPIEACERIVRGYRSAPEIRFGGAAFYTPAADAVTMPRPERFEKAEGYYATLFHELGHSTGHWTRLAREGVVNPARFASHAYSREELVAEMTAAYLSGVAGIEQATIENSAAYIDGWRRKLKGDPTCVVIAAAQAQKAADMILGTTFETEEQS